MHKLINIKNRRIPPKLALDNGTSARLQGDPASGVSLILIESNSLRRDGLVSILDSTRFRVVASYSSFEAIPSSLVEHSPDLILIGGNHTAFIIDVLKNCSERFPSARRVVLNDFHGEHVMMMLDAGAHACLGTDITTEALLISLNLVTMGNSIVCRPDPVLKGKHSEINHQNGHAVENTMSGQRSSNEVSHSLSTREIAILQCLMHGDSNKLIARQFGIAEATVKVHVKAILRKIRALNRTQAAIWAIEHLRPSMKAA
jgi:two-component system, NarL family, nitrate/nitrite response regulator NarL